MSKFEKKALEKINLTEGILGTVLKYLLKPKMTKLFKELSKDVELDETQKAMAIDLKNATEEYERSLKIFCKKYPKEM